MPQASFRGAFGPGLLEAGFQEIDNREIGILGKGKGKKFFMQVIDELRRIREHKKKHETRSAFRLGKCSSLSVRRY